MDILMPHHALTPTGYLRQHYAEPYRDNFLTDYSGRVFFTTTAGGNRMPVRATQYNSSTVTCIRTCNTICLAGHCELSMRIYLLLLGLQLISNTRVADNGSPAYRRWQRPAERDRPTRATTLKHDILDQLHAIGHPTTAPLHTPRRHVD